MKEVELVPYSENWPKYFDLIERELLAVFNQDTIQVQHVGSTSIPNLVAKPVIDIVLGADSLAVVENQISNLTQLNYQYISKYERDLPMRRYFVKAAGDLPRIHLHCVVLNSQIWQEHILFRDALRADNTLLDQYRTLKTELAIRFANDKSAYTLAKAPFIESIIRSPQGMSRGV